jgi:hypothetical protein
MHFTVQEKLIIKYWNFDFYSIYKLFTVDVRQRWKELQSSVAETIARLKQFFFFSLHFSDERVFSLL